MAMSMSYTYNSHCWILGKHFQAKEMSKFKQLAFLPTGQNKIHS